jgi:DNA polymerase-3 subunit gamma/tau
MTTELYRIHRPKLFKHVLGQETACAQLQKSLKAGNLPQVLLFSGPSGTGKTTLSRILKEKLNCSDPDFIEINAAETRGIDVVRDIKSRIGYAPLGGDCRIWYLDEVHKLTNDAQNAMLKILEDTPPTARFLMATTDPQKLIPTFRSRCTIVPLVSITPTALTQLIQDTLPKLKKKLSEDVVDKIVNVANGSGRRAMVILQQVLTQETEEEQLDIISKEDSEKQAKELVEALIFSKGWPAVSKLLREVQEEPETIRRMVVGYAAALVVNNHKMTNRCVWILEEFRDHYYDIGKPGLVLSAYNVSTRKQ